MYPMHVTHLENENLSRPYDIWKHSKTLLDNPISELSRGDAISNLKRALNHRLKLIEKLYSTKSLPLGISAKKQLERLEILGVIRPLMLRKLMEVRNLIEHEDEVPPPLTRCEEFLDFIWYFLKSTDSIVASLAHDYRYTTYLGEYMYTAVIKYESKPEWSFWMSGRLPKYILSTEKKSEDDLRIELDEFIEVTNIPAGGYSLKGALVLSDPQKVVLAKQFLTLP